MSRYVVEAERDGRFWFLRVVGRHDLFTQSLRLDQAEDMVRDLIAAMDDVDAESVEVEIQPVIEDLDAEVIQARAEKVIADHFAYMASTSLRTVARRLSRMGLSVRDVGRILGISHQRAAQLLTGDEPRHPELPDDERVTRRVDEILSSFAGEPAKGKRRPPLEILEREAAEREAATRR